MFGGLTPGARYAFWHRHQQKSRHKRKEGLRLEMGDMNDTFAVVTRGLTKRFGSLTAVDAVSLRVRQGEIYGLLGPNGAGKTTLIRMLLGLVRPSEGEATVLGRRVPDKGALSAIGYMTQSEALYQDLTVRENLEFFATVFGSRSSARVHELLELVDLQERADTLVATLSGGTKRRVSLACALVHHPQLLLLDEPTVGIDPQLRALLWSHFRRMSEEGVTLVISSHVMDEAERCSRLGFLRDGKLLAEGSAGELRASTGKATLEEAFLHYAGASDEPS